MKILILGGGISGLTAAWHLQNRHPHAHITILEKEPRLGGLIQTHFCEETPVEIGPRTFVEGRSHCLLRLIHEMDLEKDLLLSSPNSAKRFLWQNGALHPMRSYLPMILKALAQEAFRPRNPQLEESIYEFAKRRFNRKIAETLFDPMVLGIYAGDIRELSLRSCLPFLHRWEASGMSVFRGLWTAPKGGRLFTLKRGMSSLISALEQKLKVDIVRNCPVTAILSDGVQAGNHVWKADRIISALPGHVLGTLTGLWTDFPTQSLWVVPCAFHKKYPKIQGFGYLVPSTEKEALMGMIWDSSMFARGDATMYTAMVRSHGDAAWIEAYVKEILKKHLGCGEPDWIEPRFMKEAIPQFKVGFRDRLAKMQKGLPSHITLIGNYIDGVSVDACVEQAYSLDIS
jgi:oxygen-dependent protoporphyrinogen oxidase